jgi:hypothetical protein
MEKIGCVYFILQEVTGLIKIGYSENPDPRSRLRSLSTSSPFNLTIIGYILTGNPLKKEKEIHQLFHEYNVNREWFNIDFNNCIKYIGQELNGVVYLSESKAVKNDIKLNKEETDEILNHLLIASKSMSKKNVIKFVLHNYPKINVIRLAERMKVSRMYIYKVKKTLLALSLPHDPETTTSAAISRSESKEVPILPR